MSGQILLSFKETILKQKHVVKAITLWQPWAQAIALGLKKYKTCGWSTRYRGPIAIHAAARPMSAQYRALAERFQIKECPYSAIVAFAELVDCIPMAKEFIQLQTSEEILLGDWQVGHFAWKLENVSMLKKPIPAKGLQGLWNLRFTP